MSLFIVSCPWYVTIYCFVSMICHHLLFRVHGMSPFIVQCPWYVTIYCSVSMICHHLLFRVHDISPFIVQCPWYVTIYCFVSMICYHLLFRFHDMSPFIVQCPWYVTIYCFVSMICHHLLFRVHDMSPFTVPVQDREWGRVSIPIPSYIVLRLYIVKIIKKWHCAYISIDIVGFLWRMATKHILVFKDTFLIPFFQSISSISYFPFPT